MQVGGHVTSSGGYSYLPARISSSGNRCVSVGNVEAVIKNQDDTEIQYFAPEYYRVFCWGLNDPDMLGIGEHRGEVHIPLSLKDTTGTELQGVSEVACGANHILFLVSNDLEQPHISHVYGCGRESRGRLASSGEGASGRSSAMRRRTTFMNRMSELAKSPRQKFAVAGNALRASGSGMAGVTSSEKTSEKESTTLPRLVWIGPNPAVGVSKICCGADHCLALCSQDHLYTWGANSEGQCGVGHFRDVRSPTLVEYLKDASVSHISAGEKHSLVVASIGREVITAGLLYTWGANGFGCLGHSGEQSKPLPTAVDAFVKAKRRVKFCAGGPSISGAIDDDHRTWIWGDGSNGCLGQGDTNNSPDPKAVSLEIHAAAQLALGGKHCVALTGAPNSLIYLWGLGPAAAATIDDANQMVLEPRMLDLKRLIADGIQVVQVAAGEAQTLLLCDSGELYSFGEPTNGCLGNGSVKPLSFPRRVLKVQREDGPVVVGFRKQPVNQNISAKRMQSIDSFVEDLLDDDGFDLLEDLSESNGAASPSETAESESSPMASPVECKTFCPPESFGAIQELFRNEPMDCLTKALMAREKDVRKRFMACLADIGTLAAKESKLVLLQNNFDALFSKNLRFIKAGKRPEFGNVIGGGPIAKYIEKYEELTWILQQQVAYLVSLAMCLDNDKEMQVFYQTTRGIFGDLEDNRTHFLFAALVRNMIAKEAEHARKMKDVFDHDKTGKSGKGKDKSVAFHLMSYFALHQVHYKSLVHKLMDTSKPKTLMSKIVHICDTEDVWALTVEDFKKAPQNEDRIKEYDPKEVQMEFQQSVLKFGTFMTEGFMKTIKVATLPPTIQKLFSFSWAEIERRRFTDGESSLEPLLRLFMFGIIVPMLRGASKYAGSEAFLSSDMGKRLEQENAGLNFNIDCLCRFLIKAFGQGDFGEGPEGREFKKIADYLKPEMAKYLNKQLRGVHDDINTQLLFAVCLAHYDSTPSKVLIPGSVLLSLSNALKKNITKLSINDQDMVAAICEIIPEWSDDQIETAKENDNVEVMNIRSRFLLKEMTLTVCPSSQCPVPPQMSTETLEPGKIFGNLVRPFLGAEAEFSVFENVFKDIQVNLKSTTFRGLHKELGGEFLRVSKPGTPEANFGFAHRLTACLDRVEELMALDEKPEEIMNALRVLLASRQAHRDYCEQVDHGLRTASEAQKAHAVYVEQATKRFDDANKFSLTLSLPSPLVRAAKDCDLSLRLEPAKAAISRRLELGRSDAVRGMSYAPVVSHSLKRLVKKKVVLDCKQLRESEVRLTFILKDGGVNITVLQRRRSTETIVQKISLSEEKLRTLKKAEKGETVDLPSENQCLLRFSNAKLLELIADAATSR